MKKLLTIALAVIGLSTSAQISYEGAQEAHAKLLQGALIVRTFPQNDKLEYIRENQGEEAYEAAKAEIEADNSEIRKAFASQYTRGQVYFMSAEHSQSLIDGNWNGILTDQFGKTIEQVDSMPFLIAEFSVTKTMSLAGLNVYDWDGSTWTQPPTPFPSFVSKYYFIGIMNRSYAEMVERLNEKLGG